jgi:hypothetical protein
MRSLVTAICCLALVVPAAEAADPGLWVVTGSTNAPSRYREGTASDPARNVFFDGPTTNPGLYRTFGGRETAHHHDVIPTDVKQREMYNHIGDIAWDATEGGRLLLPLESYFFGAPDTNPSKTGSFGVADPKTLQWRYYVKLDPAEIPKAMWVATTPDGLAWTSSGDDLLAYNLADVSAANAAPQGAPLRAVRRLTGAALGGGISGAAFFAGRLYVSAGEGSTNRLESVDLQTGATRVEHERPANLEREGVDVGPYSGGILHWGLANVLDGFAGTVVHLLPRGAPLTLSVSPRRLRAGRRTVVRMRATANAGGYRIPLGGVRVKLGKSSAKTDAGGRAKLRVALPRGAYRATAFFKGLRTGVARLRVTSR